MPIKYNFAMNADAIDKGILSVGKRATSLRNDIHCLCVSILANWAQSGAANVATAKAAALLENVDKYHAQAIVNWFSVYGGFDYNSKDKSFRYGATTIAVERVQEAREEPFWKLTPPKEAKAFDLPGKIQGIIEQARKRQAKSKEGDVIPQEMLDKLVAALS